MSTPLGTNAASGKPCDLESVIASKEFRSRKARKSDPKAENRALLDLTGELAKSPEDFFQKLVDAALDLSCADSTGISLLVESERRFIWPAVAGPLTPYLGEGTPRDFGPCGVVLDRDASVLFSHPERHFAYLAPIKPALEEVLLVPFHVDGKAVGTIWAVIHEPGRKFDPEDQRLLETLSRFAASAYAVLVSTGGLTPILCGKNLSVKAV